MHAILASSTAFSVGVTPARRSARCVGARPAVGRGGRVAVVRSATLNLARTADDLQAASSMTAAARRFRSVADVPARPRASSRHPTRMCGIIGIFRQDGAASAELYEGLLMLQHRGQDSAGMVTFDGQRFMEKKDNGLVANIFDKKSIDSLKGSVGIGHVRYPTAGGLSATEAQPFFVNSPLGIYLIHNGNLTNVDDLQRGLGGRMMKTNSDSEVLLNVFAEDVNKELQASPEADTDKVVFDAVTKTMKKVKGAYSCVTMVNQVGLFAFRDPNGIRPLVLGQRKAASDEDKDEWCVASEDSAFGPLGFSRVRDVNPGEAILITPDGKMESRQCVNAELSPCIFEYIYLARPDSTLNSISVYEFQLELGRRLAKRIKAREWEIDVVVPVPDGSRPSAIEIAGELELPYREGLVKNRYVGRTFIMPDQRTRELSVRRKLNAMRSVFNGKKVLLVDDSIVRGTTMSQIVQMCRNAGATKVYLASAAPPVKHPNVYGVDMPSRQEFVAHERDEEGVRELLGADGLIYQSVEDMLQAGRSMNSQIERFDASCFDGDYVSGDIDEEYLAALEAGGRGKGRKGAA